VEVETGQPIARTIAEWLAGQEPEAGTACGGGTSGALYR
jgi:hypothetical protein